MRLILSLCLCLLSLQKTKSWRIFHHGREVGGNLGKPAHSALKYDFKEITEKWFPQNLDHFDTSSNVKWKQRYFVNKKFYTGTSSGPVFLMIGGEGEANIKWMTAGSWIDTAKEYKALCFQLEHRYYGKSRPTLDMSIKNLQYLTSQQALADLAFFIESMNEQYKLEEGVKWIAFGGSYSGSLAAWLRLKYPHLVHGVMSASGPFLAEVDFKDYFNVVSSSLSNDGGECISAIQQGTNHVEKLLRHRPGQEEVTRMFKLCTPVEKSVKNTNDISNLFETLAGNFAGVVQYNKDNRIGKGKSNISIDTVCAIMADQTVGPPDKRLAAVNSLLLDATDQNCLDYKYDSMVDSYRNSSWDSLTAEGGRQWLYQTCTEFGFFQTSSYQPQNFGHNFPVDFFIQQCTDIFGPKYNKAFLDEAVKRTNILYGALNIEVTNVVFVQGSIDPWHALGVTQTVNEDAPAIYIDGTAHCANMYPEADDDLPQLKAARYQVKKLIESWLDL